MVKRVPAFALPSLLYVSVLFVIIYLISHDLLKIPEIGNPYLFVLSVVALLAGFVLDVAGWHLIAKQAIPGLKPGYSFVGSGKYLLTKYIPGKIWVIVGRAAYLNRHYNGSMLFLSSGSLYYQLVAIIMGFIAGIPMLLYIDRVLFVVALGFLALILPFSILFYRPLLGFLERIIGYVLKKRVELPVFPLKLTARLMLISLAAWVVWSSAFYLLLLSMYEASPIPFTTGLLFPLASVAGVVVIIAPGGIGIREGLLGLGLTAMGLSVAGAAAVAVTSRIWFLLAELLFFGTATVAGLIEKQLNPAPCQK